MNPLLVALVRAGVISQEEAERVNRMLDRDAARLWAEERLATAYGAALHGQQMRVLAAVEAGEVAALSSDPFWQRENARLTRDVLPVLRDVATDRALVATLSGGGLDAWTRVNQAVVDWVESYYISLDASAFGAIPGLNDVARTQVGNLINAWQRGELEAATAQGGLPQLITAMEDTFGPQRGARIAITETTRVFAESTIAAVQANPYVDQLIWLTGADEFVCPQCGPMHGMTVPKGSLFPGGVKPPLHVNCRCGVEGVSDLVASVPVGIGGAGLWSYA